MQSRFASSCIAFVSFASSSLVACAPALVRTPSTPPRADASAARAELPEWKPGDSWRYRGTTYDSRDNRFYERVTRESADAQDSVYEVETTERIRLFDKRTLRLLGGRDKTTRARHWLRERNPMWFPLTVNSTHTSSQSVLLEKGERVTFTNACRVQNYEDVTVHAGTFAAFRIDCETSDGFAEHWYAPEVKNLVKVRWLSKDYTFVAELWDYDLAK